MAQYTLVWENIQLRRIFILTHNSPIVNILFTIPPANLAPPVFMPETKTPPDGEDFYSPINATTEALTMGELSQSD